MRLRLLATMLLLLTPAQAGAEWQIKPFLGVTFGGSTTLVDLEHAAGDLKLAVGVSGVLLGEVIGVEADVGHTSGFFQSGGQGLVLNSGVTTLTGNVVIAMPRRLTEYTLRPYVVGGAGLIRARIDPGNGSINLQALQVRSHLPALDIGGGLVGFLTDRIGLGWDVRYFRSIRGKTAGEGLSIGPEQLSFWRANMSIAVRF
jgi:hypothetical protein